MRAATVLDGDRLAELMAELGYPVSAELMGRKLQQFSESETDSVFAGQLDGRIVAVISVHIIPLFHAPGNLGRITSLVVSADYQRAGIGRQLVEAAEAFSRDKGCERMEVTSSNHRQGAHAFYEKAGYEQSPHGRFIKNL